MYELKQVESLPTQEQSIKLHPNAIEILFNHRGEIKKAFSNLKGLHGISHMGIACIDPSNELVAFSTTPSIEYNLMHQNLWMHDHCFAADKGPKNTLLWWDYELEKLGQLKLLNNRFTVGMTICRPVGQFYLVYSFATQEKHKGLRQYYSENLFGLMDMGDYFFKSIRDVYGAYIQKHAPPQLSEFTSKASGLNIKPFLRVVRNINNIR